MQSTSCIQVKFSNLKFQSKALIAPPQKPRQLQLATKPIEIFLNKLLSYQKKTAEEKLTDNYVNELAQLVTTTEQHIIRLKQQEALALLVIKKMGNFQSRLARYTRLFTFVIKQKNDPLSFDFFEIDNYIRLLQNEIASLSDFNFIAYSDTQLKCVTEMKLYLENLTAFRKKTNAQCQSQMEVFRKTIKEFKSCLHLSADCRYLSLSKEQKSFYENIEIKKQSLIILIELLKKIAQSPDYYYAANELHQTCKSMLEHFDYHYERYVKTMENFLLSPPDAFKCSLTGKKITIPVILFDGTSCDKKEAEIQKISIAGINFTLKKLIENFEATNILPLEPPEEIIDTCTTELFKKPVYCSSEFTYELSTLLTFNKDKKEPQDLLRIRLNPIAGTKEAPQYFLDNIAIIRYIQSYKEILSSPLLQKTQRILVERINRSKLQAASSIKVDDVKSETHLITVSLFTSPPNLDTSVNVSRKEINRSISPS